MLDRHSQLDPVVRRVHQILLRTEIPLSRLDRGVAQQHLNLLQLPARSPAQFGGCAPTIVSRHRPAGSRSVVGATEVWPLAAVPLVRANPRVRTALLAMRRSIRRSASTPTAAHIGPVTGGRNAVECGVPLSRASGRSVATPNASRALAKMQRPTEPYELTCTFGKPA
jgi:hypothetical protein